LQQGASGLLYWEAELGSSPFHGIFIEGQEAILGGPAQGCGEEAAGFIRGWGTHFMIAYTPLRISGSANPVLRQKLERISDGLCCMGAGRKIVVPIIDAKNSVGDGPVLRMGLLVELV
jgi:hypothetical protein